MDEIRRLLDQVERYRRMMKTIDDKKARDALEALARESEEKASKLQLDAEERRRPKGNDPA